MTITYRYSTEEDYNIIRELIGLRFGNRDDKGVYDNLDGRYLLAFDNELLVGMTGLIDEGNYTGPEIDWTCLRKEYEGNGIITTLISKVIDGVDKDIYCSCWRYGQNNNVNLHYSMTTLGFRPAIIGHKRFNVKYNKCKNICVKSCDGCYCFEDLYVKEHGGNENGQD